MAKKVNIKELSRRYTTAVFELAKSDKALDAVAKDLESIKELLASDADLKKLLSSPLLNEEKQINIVREIGKAAKFNTHTTNLLLVVARNGRLNYLSGIIDAFAERIAEENGEITAELITASEIGAEQLKQISKELGGKTGKTVKVVQNVDENIIGGLIVKIGPKMYDFSVRSRLNKLKNKLRSAS